MNDPVRILLVSGGLRHGSTNGALHGPTGSSAIRQCASASSRCWRRWPITSRSGAPRRAG
jgi:hypothetical protein